MDNIKSKIKVSDRCFILGNGPSLNNVNLNLLKDEVTIACNTFMEGLAERNDFFFTNNIMWW